MILGRAFRMIVAMLLACTGSVLAADDPPPLDAYGDLPGVEEMAISPNGKRIATIGRINRQRQLLVSEGDKPLVLFPIDDMKIREVLWAGDEMIVMIASRTDKLPFGFTAKKAEIFGTILIPLDGSKSKMVFSNRRNLGNFTSGRYGIRNVDGLWKGYFGGVELEMDGGRTTWLYKRGSPALFEIDLKKNKPKKSPHQLTTIIINAGWSMRMAQSP